MSTSATAVRQWLDWCYARDVLPTSATWAHVDQFTHDFPASPATTARRLSAIRGYYRTRQRSLTGQPDVLPDLWPAHAAPHLLEDRLENLAVYGYPHAVLARRAAIITLLASQRLTRTQITRTQPDAVSLLGERALNGHPLARTRDATRCPACALTRWLRVLARHHGRYGLYAHELVVNDRPADTHWHDCLPAVEEEWESAPRLLVRIRPNGELTDAPISPVAVTRALQLSSTLAAPAMPPPPPVRACGHAPRDAPRPVDRVEASRSLDELLDRLDREVDQLNARALQVSRDD